MVSSAGAMTLEWNALRPSDGNFRVRTLGLCSSIALGMALGLPHRKIVALDGDGSLLLNLCSLPTIARMHPKNLVHIVFDNEVYEASGSKMTATGCGTDLVGIAAAAGIQNTRWAKSLDEFSQAAAEALKGRDLHFIGAKVTTERTEVPTVSGGRGGEQIPLYSACGNDREDRDSKDESAGELQLNESFKWFQSFKSFKPCDKRIGSKLQSQRSLTV